MKQIFTLFCLILLMPAVWAKHVPQQNAQQLAVTFYRLNSPSGIQDPQVRSATTRSWESTPAFYIFRFVTGGFVIVSADDAAIPILGYSFENEMPETIDNPATNEWLDAYSREIAFIISKDMDNKETLKEWNSIREEHSLKSAQDVQPLLSTLWDQGCYYNALCPADNGGDCGHVWTGCVATCMAQIMKYHNYPPQGVGQHTYNDPPYGQQTADFGNTTYNWTSMPNQLMGSNSAVATLMYHNGVAVDMQYGTSGSGAQSEDVPGALLNYFNYSPEIDIKYKDNYPNVEDFKNLLRADLDQSLPIYYSGSGTEGHAFVCDGYRMSDGKFHFNWGWSGSSNGYYAIGNLNPGGYTFNNDNTVVVHIKPYDPNLIVRITHPVDKVVIGVGYPAQFHAAIIRGSCTTMKLFIDSTEVFSTTADSLDFTWNTSASDLGAHVVKAYAYSATDTVYYKISVNVAEWISQATGFTTANRALTYMSAVDSNTVWGTAADASNPTGACSDFTRTTNGGSTWTPGVITNTTGLASSMIFGMDSLTAYVAMFKVSGNQPQGIYMTSDGGATWARQSTASYSNSASFPDVVHFFNTNEGVAIGDPNPNEFEIYTTTNGGTNWTLVSGSNIPNPQSGEYGVVGYYSTVNDTIWFGTNMGRVYKSVDKGQHWTVASSISAMSGTFVKPVFRDGSHGLLQDESSGTGLLCESSDGGATWTQVNYTGPDYSADLSYVPGTPNTWVRSGYTNSLGCAYSFNGGHDWYDFIGTTGAKYYQMSWINNHCGWAGGINTNATEDGAYRFIGLLRPALPAPFNVQAAASLHNVTITWNKPVYDSTIMTLMGYNLRRNGTRLNPFPITTPTYTDMAVPSGQYTYCVSALYNIGESPDSCSIVDVAVGIAPPGTQPSLSLYPNPAHGRLYVKTDLQPNVITVFDQQGDAMSLPVRTVQAGLSVIDISSLPAGFYLVSVKTADGISRAKLVVY